MKSNDSCSKLNVYEIISKKKDGLELTTEEIHYFINGVVANQIPDYQTAALLMAIYFRGLNQRELADLTHFMMLSGERISLADIDGIKIDKHSTGGVGDKISFIVSPLVAACGVKVPMLSGRSLGHTGGTLDKLAAIPGMNIALEPPEFKRVLNEAGMVICGQTSNLVPADRKLYALRDATATVNSIPLICASIMSKKLALGTDGIVLDVKTGCGAFTCRLEDSIALCKTMVATGEASGRTTIGLITDMNQPLGNAVGNSLEISEAIEALKGNGPGDLMTVAYGLGAAMLVAAGVESEYGSALLRLEKALKSGQPLAIFRKFITAQGGNADICENYALLPQSNHQAPVTAGETGYISRIDAYEVGMAAIDIGAGRRKQEDIIDYSAGFVFHKKIGDEIKKNEAVLTIHTNKAECLTNAEERLKKAISISAEKVVKPQMIRFLVEKNGLKDWSDVVR